MRNYIYIPFFLISLILSVLFFGALAVSMFDKVIMWCTAATFELGKIYLWKLWKEELNKIAMVLSYGFIALSIVGSVFFTTGLLGLQIKALGVEGFENTQQTSIVEGIDRDIEALREARNSLPETWVTHKLNYTAKIDELVGKRSEIVFNSIASQKNNDDSANVFKFLGDIIKVPPITLVFIFFGLFALFLEAGAIVLTPFKPKELVIPQVVTEITKEEDPLRKQRKRTLRNMLNFVLENEKVTIDDVSIGIGFDDKKYIGIALDHFADKKILQRIGGVYSFKESMRPKIQEKLKEFV